MLDMIAKTVEFQQQGHNKTIAKDLAVCEWAKQHREEWEQWMPSAAICLEGIPLLGTPPIRSWCVRWSLRATVRWQSCISIGFPIGLLRVRMTFRRSPARPLARVPAGTYFDADASSCVPCPFGLMSKARSAGIEACVPCDVFVHGAAVGGYEFVPGEGCAPCPAGSHAAPSGGSAEALECSLCPPGTYAGEGQGACTPCAGDFWTLQACPDPQKC